MPKTLPQATGATTSVIVGLENAYPELAPQDAGKVLRFISEGVADSQELQQSAVIRQDRNPDEPFVGNGDVGGDIVVPTDIEQMFELFKLTFGTPQTTAPTDFVTLSAVADNNSNLAGTVEFTTSSAHGITKGQGFIVVGTTNYNGGYIARRVTSTKIVVDADYVAESFTSSSKVTKTGYTHVFEVKDKQPSFTMEKVYRNIAANRVLTGCKVSSLQFGAGTDGSENQTTFSVMGNRPVEPIEPFEISAIAEGSGTGLVDLTLTESATDIIAEGQDVIISGTANYDGRHEVAGVDGTTLTIAADYVAETITEGQEPLLTPVHFTQPTALGLSRVYNFGASLYQNGIEYGYAKSFNATFDMGLDGDQRTFADKGWRSECPEGTTSINIEMTLCYKSDEAYRAAANFLDMHLQLRMERKNGLERIVVDIPHSHYQRQGVPVDTSRALTQSITAIGFSKVDAESVAKITVVNGIAG